MRIAVLLGLLMFAVPGGLAALLLRTDAESVAAPPPRTATPTPVPGWNDADRESLAALRQVTIDQARQVVRELKACETRAARRRHVKRAVHYNRCARPALARADGIGTANGRMLAGLVNTTAPTDACRSRIEHLSGAAGNLGGTANGLLRGGFTVPWRELLAASRSVRGLAGEAHRLAREPGWSKVCRARPPAPAPAAPVA